MPEEVYTLELSKVPTVNDGTAVWEWLQFLRAKQKEEFEMIAERNPEIRKAVDTLYELSADEEVRAAYEMRQKALRDKLTQIDDSYQEGLAKGKHEGREEGREEGKIEDARKMKELGFSVENICAVTGFPEETIEKL